MSQMKTETYFDDTHGCDAVRYTDDHVEMEIDILEEGVGYVNWIGVEDGFRGQGLGTAAIEAALEDFDTLYFAPVDEKCAHLYARLGTLVVGEDVTSAAPFECLYSLDQGFGVYEVSA